jgi:hypothetical protein
MYVTDSDPSHVFTFPPGTTIPAGGYRVLVGSGVDFDFGLGSADSVVLRAAGDAVVDAHSWGTHAAGTFARCPDATGPWQDVPTATQGSSNVTSCSGGVLAAQTVSFTSTAPTDPAAGTTYAVSATGGGTGNPVVFSIDPGSSPVCSVEDALVTFTAAGSCVIDADQEGGPGYAPGHASQTVVVQDGPVVDPEIHATVTSSRPRSTAGWYRAPVTITFTCIPHGSPLVGPCPSPVVLTGSGADQSVTRTITAQDGGSATVTRDNIDIDRVAPVVKVKGATPRCAAKDPLSGVARCALKTKRVGDRLVVTATAVDRAGNKAKAKRTYRLS